MTKTTYASVVVSETKLNNSILSNEIQIEGYNILRLDRSQRGGGVAYVKKKLVCNYKDYLCKYNESIFIVFFLPKTKPTLVGIL